MEEIESIAPDAALVPVLKFPTQSQYSAARSEFGIVMKLPTTSPKFLAAIREGQAERSILGINRSPEVAVLPPRTR